MPETSAPAVLSKIRCLLWGRRNPADAESLEWESAMGRRGWAVSVQGLGGPEPGPGGFFDIILVEDPEAAPPERVRALKQGSTLTALLVRGHVTADRLAPFDVVFCADLSWVQALRGAGLTVFLLTSGLDRSQRCLEVLERQWRYRREVPAQVDWSRISYGHTEISRDQVTGSMTSAWRSEEIPARQRALVQTELLEMYRGRTPKVYQTLADALRPYAVEGLRILEIGCASGYYSEILEYLLNRRLDYEGADYSEALIRMARSLYPSGRFHVADGAALPFPDAHFPVAISSCVLLHVPNYREHIRETARVADRVVIAHRTPVCRNRPTQYLRKFAYGVETVELLFNEEEILKAFAGEGLAKVAALDLGGNPAQDEYCLTYVFEKQAAPRIQPAPLRESPSVALPQAASAGEGFGELLKNGEAAFAAGDRERARALFLRAGRFQSEHPLLLNNLAVLAIEDGDVKTGLDLLHRAYAKDPSERKVLLNLGAVLSALDQTEIALPLLDKHLRARPEDAEVRTLRDELAAQAQTEAAGPASAPTQDFTPSQASAAPRPVVSKTLSSKPISVAWRNRPDMVAAKGGDGTVIEETIHWLKAQGHRADLRLEPFPDLREYDLVHLNNISRSQDTLEHLRHARSCGKKSVLTVLYEDMDRYLRPAMKTDLLFRYLASKRQVVPLEGIRQLRDSFELDRDPLDDPLAKQLGIGDPVRQKEILQGVDLILTSGRQESETIRRKFGAVAPIAEMHYGFNRGFRDADARIFADRHGLKDFALCVGRLEPRKNQWQLIEVFRSLPHLKLVLVGVFSDPSMEPLIRAYAPPNVIFFPRLPLEELASAYAAARLHVLPSWYELPGLVSLEAAAAGCRVATTDWGTSRDYFGGLAHYLTPEDPVRMRREILEAFESAPKAGLREHVLESFSWEKTALAAVEAYRRVLETA